MNMAKRLTWVIQLSVLTIFAWVTAGILTTVAGYYLYETPLPGEKTLSQESHKKENSRSKDAYMVVIERDLLKVAKAGPSSGQSSLDKDVVRPIAEMGLILKGTIAGPQEIARAIIESTNVQKSYKIGEEVMGATLIAIFRNKVIMNVNGQEQMLVMTEDMTKDKTTRPVSPARPPQGRSASGGGSGMANVMKNLDQYIGKARIVPYFKGGEPYGFRVSNLGSDAMVYGLGVRAGDVIRSVNGMPIRTPEDAMKVYQEFQDESNIQVELERNGQPTMITVPLKH